MPPEILGNIGRCIYCPATENLSDEHVLPYSLGGRSILKNASCSKCAEITSRFERDVARNLWPSTRFLYGIQSKRRPLERPSTFSITATTEDGQTHLVELSPERYGGVTPFIGFELPGHLTGMPTQGIAISSHSLNRNGGYDFRNLEQELGSPVRSVELNTRFSPSAFARMVAKIAYGFAVAHYGLERMHRNSFVLPAILGQRDDIGMWVGSSPVDTQDSAQDFGIEVFETNREVHARVRFFGKLTGAMTYLVILGGME